MSDSPNSNSPKIEETSKGLREMLFEMLGRLRAGKCTVAEARAIASVSSAIVQTVDMEIRVAELRKNYPGDTKLIVPPPLQLK